MLPAGDNPTLCTVATCLAQIDLWMNEDTYGNGVDTLPQKLDEEVAPDFGL